ncbi:MAG: hypothetical protein VR73_01325 [Gammaproteobacteria bacterium BRH_c0]|nr:MAG: hypothetical protein VR73_01325 [Gammaproteobacteria bacterium BRH_c0]
MRDARNFLLPMVAALAVIIGAVQIWDVPVNKLYSALVFALILVAVLALLAFVTVLVIKSLQKWLKK